VCVVVGRNTKRKKRQRHRRDLTFARAYTNNKSYLFLHLERHAASDAAEKWSDGRVAWEFNGPGGG
jgi:hypothetical protein